MSTSNAVKNNNDFGHVVITGGTGGLGTAVTEAFLQRGAEIHIPAFKQKEIDNFKYAANEHVHITPDINLTSEQSVVDYYSSLPPIWASVHIAGGFAMAALGDTSKDDFMAQMNLNALSAFLCCREAVAKMDTKAGGAGGRIVNVAARPALEPRTGAGMAAYTSSKAAVAALTEALGEELAPSGVLVNAIAPSILDTPPNRAAMPDADFTAWPKVEEVAQTILFLASAENTVTRSSVVAVYGKS